MSDDSITYGEDKENLLYISKKINVDEFGLGEEGPFKESISTIGSEVSVKPIGSEVKLLQNIGDLPHIFSDPQSARRFKPFQALINCISSDSNGDWLVSSDGDRDGCLIIWSSKDLSPIYTLFGLYPDSGILLTALSPCGRYLLTVGQAGEYYPVDFWLWTFGGEAANDTFLVHISHGPPVKICFNPDIEEHIMLIFDNQVFLLVWDPANKKLLPSVIPHMTNKGRIGTLTCGTYMKECHECYATSSRGCILVFRNTLYGRNYEEGELNNSKMYINAIKVTPASIGVITTTEGVLVVGDSKGHILFFDKRIKLLYWIRNMPLGAITSISFSISPKMYRYENEKIVIRAKDLDVDDMILDCDYQDMEPEITKLVDAPFDATLDNKPFTVRDFFLSTADCNIYAFDFIYNTGTPLFQVADANISAIDAHDEMPYIVIGYENGRVALIDFEKKEQISSYLLPKTEETTEGGDVITCIKFSHESLHLVCGRANGEIWILEPVILKPKVSTPFKYNYTKIVKIEFSYNSLQFAYYDINKTVFLFNYHPEQNCWEFRGKVRSHYDQITDIRFFRTRDDNSSILHTIGADRYLVEYNNLEMRGISDTEIIFATTSRERIEQSAIPMTFECYERKFGARSTGYILLADDKHKMKTVHGVSKVPRSLVLGPAFGCFKNTHVKKMRVLPEFMSRYLVFITQKHIGLQILPADGNPYKHTGYLAHPKQVADFAVSYNGLYAFTYGVEDRCILQWEIRTRSVDLLSIMGGTELEPFYCLLEGGKNGWLFQEIQDLFFYMQILQQENIDLPRRVSDSINLSEIPDLVRSCGYYPSHFELEIMMIDIRYRDYDESGIVRDDISFVEFVKLFINHRPTYGYFLTHIKRNFKTVCLMADYPRRDRIETHDLVYLLQTVGEPSPKLRKNLTTLLRTVATSENNFDFLPPDITTDFLFHELLGIDPSESEKSPDDYESETNFAFYSSSLR